jgi:hypothetical protein
VRCGCRRGGSGRGGARRLGWRARWAGEAIFGDYGDVEIGPGLLQELDCRGGEDAVSEGAQAEDGDAAAGGESIEGVRLRGHAGWLFVDGGLVNEHDGDFIADGVEAVAGNAPEAARIGFELDFRAASRADEDFEEVGADGHGKFSLTGWAEV